jgi:hypothetical protein
MMNIVKKQISRNHANSHRFHAAAHILSLQRYGNDINVLCRSLRRSDSFYTFFGHVVGKLLCEALYTKGDRVVNYMQLRIMRVEVTRALQAAITFLLETEQEINIDRVGQPEAVSLYTYDGEVIFLDKNPEDDIEESTTKKRKVSSSNPDGKDTSVVASLVSTAVPPSGMAPVAPIFYNMQIFPPNPMGPVGLGPMLTSTGSTGAVGVASTSGSCVAKRGR